MREIKWRTLMATNARKLEVGGCFFSDIEFVYKIQIKQPTRWINFSELLFVVQVQLNMFRAFSCPLSGAYKLQIAASSLPLERGGSSAVGRGRSDRTDHDQRHCYHHVPTVNRRRLLQFISS
jgi:hypothetical protein